MKVSLILICTCLLLSARSQEEIFKENHVKLSYDRDSRGWIFIPATVNGKQGVFFLDTGTGRSRIFPGFAKEIGMKGKEDKVEIKIGELSWSDVHVAQVTDFKWTDPSGNKVVGILGGTLLKNTIFYLDAFKRQVAFLSKLDTKEVKAWTSIEIDFFKGAPFLQVKINDTDPQWFTLDTGADKCTILPRFYKDMKLDPNSPEAKPHEIHTASGTFPAKLIPAKTVHLGDLKVENIMTQVVTGKSPWGEEGKKAGNLGQNLLEHFLVIIDYPDKKLYLKKNTKGASDNK